MFNEGWTNMLVSPPSYHWRTREKKIKNKIQDTHFILAGFHSFFPEIWRPFTYEIVKIPLGYKRMCASWVLLMLIDDHKNKEWEVLWHSLLVIIKRKTTFWIILLTVMRQGSLAKLQKQNINHWNCIIPNHQQN